MASVEASYWWYRGLRDVVARCLRRPELDPGTRPRVLDAGCGSGANLEFLDGLLRPSYLGGFDVSARALELARDKCPGAELYRGDICDPEIRVDALDLIVSFDVIYIPGVARALNGLRRLVEALRPGGLLIVNLPAYDWLYSTHDVAIHTSERYTLRRLRGLLERLALDPVRLSYRLCLLFPAVVITRLPGMLAARRGIRGATSDLHRIPGRPINEALVRILGFENRMIASGARLPWGSSVFAVARKSG